jgi:hypothetical protein
MAGLDAVRDMVDQFQRHFTASAELGASVHEVFAYLDNPARLSTHMTRSSWMMGGGTMQVSMDEGAGARVGSRIRLSGKAFGLSLSVDEAVTQREPPAMKTWETLGEPKLLVIGRYRMGFQVTDSWSRAKLQVFIDYDLPRKGFARMLGWLLGRVYAAWCVKSMLADAAAHFAAQATQPRHAMPEQSA